VIRQSPANEPVAASAAAGPVVQIVGLVDRFLPPRPPGARTRPSVPRGYGTREQCQPFAAAAACGLAIPSPISWGVAPASELPPDARPFRSPVRGDVTDDRWCYVVDDERLGFLANSFGLSTWAARHTGTAPIPGISFFDRPDQQGLLKIHLPYSWRTSAGLAILVVDPINRPHASGLRVVAGLVETAWYANPINLVLELPPPPAAIHLHAGEPLAQAVVVRLADTDPEARVVVDLADAGPQLDDIRAWRAAHARNRSAYKRLARAAATSGGEGAR
jgi:hypothetical protein